MSPVCRKDAASTPNGSHARPRQSHNVALTCPNRLDVSNIEFGLAKLFQTHTPCYSAKGRVTFWHRTFNFSFLETFQKTTETRTALSK